jgi:hypothetical protein
MERNEILAMALAAVADDLDTEPERLRVIRFREVPESALDTYLRARGTAFRRFQVEGSE